jgi:GTPase SAR1 family protein
VSDFYNKFFIKKAKILLLGLDAAGKTSYLYNMILDSIMQTVPTIGFNVEKISYKNLDL